MIAKLFALFAFQGVYGNQRKREEAWLSKSDNLVELERRLRALQRGDVNIW